MRPIYVNPIEEALHHAGDALTKLQNGEEVNFAHRIVGPGVRGFIIIQSMTFTVKRVKSRSRSRKFK